MTSYFNLDDGCCLFLWIPSTHPSSTGCKHPAGESTKFLFDFYRKYLKDLKTPRDPILGDKPYNTIFAFFSPIEVSFMNRMIELRLLPVMCVSHPP
jgi:hypothetical protein